MRRRSGLVVSAAFVLLLAGRGALAEELRHDGWQASHDAEFQAGFALGEIAAARFVPQQACPCALTAIAFLYGGEPGTRNLLIRIWDDSAGELAPGAELRSEPVQVTADDNLLQLLDLDDDPVTVDGPFRVGIVHLDDGLPGVAADDDGTISENDNFVFAGGQWQRSSDDGVTGDWILRAQVTSSAQSLCGQPLTSGDVPTASDCLHVLRASVGSSACDPECICDTDGSGATTTGDALLCLRKAVGQDVDLECSCN